MPLQKKTLSKGHFGAMELTEYEDTGIIKTVYPPTKEFIRDYEWQTQAIQQAQKQILVNKERMNANTIYQCDNRIPSDDPHSKGYFLPVSVGPLNSASPSIVFT